MFTPATARTPLPPSVVPPTTWKACREPLLSGSVLFLAIASFALMTLVIGSLNWLGMAGMVVPIAVLLLGLGTANLPYEYLPGFWQDWVYPWNPLRFLAEGSRALLFQGAGWWNPTTLGLIITAIVGVTLVGSSVLRPATKRTPAEPERR
ncbi:hypothetical protein SAMN06298212_10669 [Ruaniaceae bacterium KH17]|nr:hypothetical protein SAMN06298212_10669 [Ruaniaceae bacterium KH17]